MTERKHILIVGAGAIGGLYAAYLAKVADVAVLDTNRAHVEAIRQNGLKLAGCTESVTKLAAFASAAEIGKRRFDSVIILVKSQATGAALVSIRPALEGRPLLVTFQNGMGNEELLMGLTDLDVAHGVSFEAARHDGPGRVHHLVHGEDSWLGPARGKVESIAWLGERTRGFHARLGSSRCRQLRKSSISLKPKRTEPAKPAAMSAPTG